MSIPPRVNRFIATGKPELGAGPVTSRESSGIDLVPRWSYALPTVLCKSTVLLLNYRGIKLERVMRIELTYDFRLTAWKAVALPMYHTRIKLELPIGAAPIFPR